MDARPGERISLPQALAIVGAVALAVRLVFFFQLGDTPFGRTPFLDAGYYWAWAERIAAGDWLGGTEPFFVEPGYLYVLAGLRWLGADLTTLRLAQACVGAGTAVLTTLLTARLSGSNLGAVFAGTGVAAYGPLVHFEGQLLKTTLEVFVATGALAVAVAPRWRPLALGVVSGVAMVLKSNFAVVLPALLVFGAWRSRAVGSAAAPAIAWMLLGMAPLLIATAARNGVVSGEPLLLPWSSGINFYIGNGPEADGLDPTLPFAEAGPSGEGREGKREAERRAGRVLGFAESSDFWWDETWKRIGHDPIRTIVLLTDKARLTVHHHEFTDNVSFYFVRERAPVLYALIVGAWLAVPLAFVGVVGAGVRREPGLLLVAAYIVLQAAGIIAFHVIDRYRLAIVPAAVALGVTAVVDSRRGRGAPWLALCGVALLGGIATFVPPPVGGQGQNMAGHHRMIAIDAQEHGDYAVAIAEFERAIALNPRVQNAHLRLAVARRLAGDDAGAAQAERRGLQIDPQRGPLRLGLLLAPHDPARAADYCLRAARQGDRTGAALHCAGTALHRAGRTREAAGILVEATSYAPRFFAAWVELGDVRLELGDIAGARAAWTEAAALRPDDRALRSRIDAAARRQAPSEGPQSPPQAAPLSPPPGALPPRPPNPRPGS